MTSVKTDRSTAPWWTPRGTAETAALVVAIATTIAPAGCGRGHAERAATVPASGSITYQGRPLARALVVFEPIEPTTAPGGAEVPMPSATSDDAGRYTLQTYEPGDGAPPGRYRIRISTAPAPAADAGPLQKRSKEELTDVLRGRYLDPAATGLTATVADGQPVLPPIDLR